jgi:hypothetical protein
LECIRISVNETFGGGGRQAGIQYSRYGTGELLTIIIPLIEEVLF